jgi:hypothetical protein
VVASAGHGVAFHDAIDRGIHRFGGLALRDPSVRSQLQQRKRASRGLAISQSERPQPKLASAGSASSAAGGSVLSTIANAVGTAAGVAIKDGQTPIEQLTKAAANLVAPAERELAKVAGDAVIQAISQPDTAEDADPNSDLRAALLAELPDGKN